MSKGQRKKKSHKISAHKIVLFQMDGEHKVAGITSDVSLRVQLRNFLNDFR